MTSLHVSRNWLVPLDALDAASTRGPAAPYWLDLDREAYAAQPADLKRWVDTVLRPNYGGYELRDCWPSHIHVIWELSTLAAAEWYRTYNGKLPGLPGRWNSTTAGFRAPSAASANTPGPASGNAARRIALVLAWCQAGPGWPLGAGG